MKIKSQETRSKLKTDDCVFPLFSNIILQIESNLFCIIIINGLIINFPPNITSYLSKLTECYQS